MKKIIAFAAVLFFSLLSFCQSQNLSVEAVCAGLAENKITKGNFIQEKTISKNGIVIKSSGKFIFAPEGILWATEKPFSSALVLGKDYMVQVSADGTKKRTDANGNETFNSISSTLLSVFSSDVSKLKANFNVDFTEDAAGSWKVTLEPKDKTIASFMRNIILTGTASEKKSEIAAVELIETNDGTVLYKFSNQTHPEKLTSDEKSFFNN